MRVLVPGVWEKKEKEKKEEEEEGKETRFLRLVADHLLNLPEDLFMTMMLNTMPEEVETEEAEEEGAKEEMKIDSPASTKTSNSSAGNTRRLLHPTSPLQKRHLAAELEELVGEEEEEKWKEGEKMG